MPPRKLPTRAQLHLFPNPLLPSRRDTPRDDIDCDNTTADNDDNDKHDDDDDDDIDDDDDNARSSSTREAAIIAVALK